MIEVGTRTRANELHIAPPSGHMTRGITRDLGLSKLATASLTYAAGSGEVTAVNGTFSAFAIGDLVLSEGTNLNNGFFTVTAIDTLNGAYLVLSPAPTTEGPVTATIRTN